MLLFTCSVLFCYYKLDIIIITSQCLTTDLPNFPFSFLSAYFPSHSGIIFLPLKDNTLEYPLALVVNDLFLFCIKNIFSLWSS